MNLRSRVASVGLACVLVWSACGVPYGTSGGMEPLPDSPVLLSRARRSSPDTVGHGPVAKEPTGVLRLRQALALALMRNPELTAFSWQVRVREAQTLQAGLLPNPQLTVEVENFAGSGGNRSFDASETTISLGQLIELADRRLKRRRVAALEQQLAGWDYETARINVLAAGVRAFVEVLAGQERLALAKRLLRIAERSLVAVSKQVDAGAASPVERKRAEVAVATSRIERQRAKRELSSARSRLAAMWGSATAAFARAEGALYTVTPPPPAVTLTSRVAQNPEVARWMQEIERRQAVVSLEDARRIPNVTVGGGPRYLSETGDSALVFQVSVPLPLFDRNQGAALAARRDLIRARYQEQAAKVRVASALEVAYQRLQESFEEVKALGDRIIPQAEAAFEGVRRGYLRGLFRYVEVLDAQRTLFELHGRQLDALVAYHSAVAEIERLTGKPLGSSADPQSTP